MKSRSHAGSGSRWLIVGGRNPRDIASAAVTTPAAPLAPCGWPIIDFTDDPASAIGVVAEHLPHAARLDRVVQHRRRAVIVDVADLLARRAPIARSPASSRGRSPRRRAPSARGGRRRRSSRSRRSTRRSSRRARARDPRARAPSSTRLRRARSRRGPCRTAATLRPADRCRPSTRPASARSRRSCPA